MTLESKLVLAEEVEEGNFIYLPKQKRFFYVDAIDYFEDKIEFIFEEGFNMNPKPGESALIEDSIFRKYTDKIIVIEI